MMNCAKCLLELPQGGELDFTLCSKCGKGCHFDCSTVSDSSWRSMGTTRRSTWICDACRNAKSEKLKLTLPLGGSQDLTGAPNSPVNPPADYADMLDKKFTALETKLLGAFSKSEKAVVEKMGEFEKTLDFYGDKVDEANKTVKAVEQKLILMERRLEKSESENKELKTRLRLMEVQLNEVEQRQYNDKIEISGNIVNKNTDPKKFTEEVLNKAGYNPADNVEFRAQTVVKTFKVGETVNEKGCITVQFRSQHVRNEVLGKIKQQKVFGKLGSGPQSGPVFINESLSPYYKKLLFEVGRLKRDKNFAFVWVKDGKILLKKTQQSNVQRISCMEDLAKL